eukprot:228782-Heterocapsa_arctica.AAC.1
MADDEGDELRSTYVGTSEALEAAAMEPFVNKNPTAQFCTILQICAVRVCEASKEKAAAKLLAEKAAAQPLAEEHASGSMQKIVHLKSKKAELHEVVELPIMKDGEAA